MADADTPTATLADFLRDAPKNWGKWGPDDEIGSLNYLTPEQVLRGVGSVRSGRVFTLQVAMGSPGGDPVWPGPRIPAIKTMVNDKGSYLAGKAPEFPGGLEYADDLMVTFLQGTTQYDALGHTWYGDQIWNGYDARSTIGGLAMASVEPIARHGVVGRGVLIDIARFRGKRSLEPGETFTQQDLIDCAGAQGTAIEPRDILIVRTGWVGRFYEVPSAEFYADWLEPGLACSDELLHWFQDFEIPNLVTDTLGNEVTFDPSTGVWLPLHAALQRNLGVLFTEIAWLEDLAQDCEADRQFDFLYAAAPLRVVGGTGAPVNPIVIK